MPAVRDFAFRPCTVDDAPVIAALGARLFVQAYGATHPEPELSRYLARSFAPTYFARELATATVCVLLAEDSAGLPIGYAQLRATDGAAPAGVVGRRPIEIVRFYVDAAWHGRGVAPALMDACAAEARAWGGDVVWLAVWQEAARPVAFYERVGFRVVGTTTFEFGARRDADYVMARALA